jgi:predicted MFS family arabinose efflux permease
VKISAYWHLLRDNRNIRLLWLAQIVSELGDWFYSVAIFSFLLEATGSAQMVSFAFMMQVLPQCFLAPTAGVINDRLSRKRVMIFADWSRAAIVLAMIPALYLARADGFIWPLFLLLFLETACWSLFEPGQRAVIPNIATGDQTPIANALSAATWSVNFAVGAGLGGLAAVWLGRNAVFALNSLSFVASALLISRMRFTEPHTEHLPGLKARDLVDFSPIADGARYIARDPKLLATIFVKGGAGIMGTNWVILPVLGERIFPIRLHGLSADQAGTLGMSTLLASRGLGAIFGAFLGGNIAGSSVRRIRWIVCAGFLMGAAGYLALGTAGSIFAAALTLVIAHAGGSATWTASTTLLQQQTEDRFRGRVFSAEFAFTMLVLALASFVAGRLADSGVAVRTLAMWTGAAMLVPAAAWVIASRGWRQAQH